MKRSLLFIALLLTAAASGLQAQTPVKHVLLEEFTGSWCGWCTRGIYAIQQLEEKYPTQFIPVAFHNGDPMVVSPEGATLEAAVTGYPDGWLDRQAQADGTWNTDPANWDGLVTTRLNDVVKADVEITNVTYTAATRVVAATVTVKFAQAVTGDLRLNMYITEDSVSGAKGSTYDQHSYLTYRAGYETNPFYSLGATVPGYQHMHVVRAVLGGAWGLTGVIPATAVVGTTYSKDFTYTLPAGSNPDHIDIVGLAFSYDATTKSKNEVFNANRAKLTDPAYVPFAGLTVTTDKNYITASASGQTTQTVTVSNSNATATQALIAIDKVFSVLPTGWTATIAPQLISVPANGQVQATVTFSAPANAAFVNAMVGVTPILANGESGVSTSAPAKINALSSATKYISFGSDALIDAATGMAKTTYAPAYASVGLDSSIMAAYPPSSFDVVIFPVVFLLDYQGLNGAPPPVAPTINSLLSSGKKVLLTSEYAGYYAFDGSGPYYQQTGGNPTDALNTLMTKLGIQYTGFQNNSNPTTGAKLGNISITGIANDAIGNGIKGAINPYQYDQWDLSTSTGTSFLYFTDPTVTAGLHFDFGSGQRLVYLDFDLQDVTVAATAEKILSKSMDFLVNGVSDVKPGTNFVSSLSNYPNPVTSSTKIEYTLTNRAPVSISIFDVLGREVGHIINGTQDAGTYSVNFDASNLSSGSYTCKLSAGEQTIENTMTVTK